MNIKELARYIDHTNLKPDARYEDIRLLCEEAKTFSFKSVCIAPLWVPEANRLLADSQTALCTVVGFPLGYSSARIKGREAAEAVSLGCSEVDMVIAVGLLKEGSDDKVFRDIASVVKASKGENSGALVKVIIECCYLTDEEKKRACLLAMEAGADYVKTSTGFGTGGATIEDVRLMRDIVGNKMGVKAAGGIRSPEQAIAMIEAGASRIGTSNGVAIVRGAG